jgi:hypothetical protein
MRNLTTVLCLLALTGAAQLSAQAAEIAPGARVRVVQATSSLTPSGLRRSATQVGTVQSVDAGSITLNVNGQSLVYPRDIIARLEVSQGHADRGVTSRRAAVRGGLIGGAITGMVGVVRVLGRDDDPWGDPPPEGRKNALEWLLVPHEAGDIPGRIVAGAGVGAVLGFAFGSRRQEQWVRVWPASTPVSVSVNPAPSGGTRVGVALRF